jgi:malonate-semialdehyde dehydrogenase (acetylating)/methylmalonate-semialdehyde dehydrogenase
LLLLPLAVSHRDAIPGGINLVSTNVSCRNRRDPLGAVASIVPLNFPFMVPHWTLPIALVCRNTIMLKPSKKVPLMMHRVVELFEVVGFPKGVVNLMKGMRDPVKDHVNHPLIRAVTFVGLSPVAKLVSDRCRALNKRCMALGGANNHLIMLPDCNVETTAGNVIVSFGG